MKTVLADQALARRLEAVESFVSAQFAEAMKLAFPEAGVEVLEVAGGYAVFTGRVSPLNQSKGLGMTGPVAADELDALEEFYFSRGSSVQVVLCPLADASLVALLGERGYRVAEFENEMSRPLDDEVPAMGAAGVTVRIADASEERAYARIMSQGFFGSDEPPSEYAPFMEVRPAGVEAVPMLACVDGQPIAGGMLLRHDGVGVLCGSCTLPEFRRRGAQNALIHARLAHARAAGCDLAKVTTQAGSDSQRNVERHGFRVAYTRVVMMRDPKRD